MKKILLVAAMLVGSMALANDAEHKVDASTDTSKNPMTGTTTTTEKYTEKAHNDATGKTANVKVTKKTKMKKDGSTSQSVKTETDSEAKTK